MRAPALRFCWLVAAFVVLGAAPSAQAQLSEVGVRLHSGMALPFGAFGGFYDPGVAVRVDVDYPVRDRVDVVLDLGLDFINSQSGTYIPDTHLWRYQLGVEADLLGDRDATFRVRPYAGLGAVTFRTKDFQVDNSTPADRSTWTNQERRNYPGYLEKITKTYLTGSGGLRLALDAGDNVVWWLSGGLNWSPVGESEVAILRTVPLGAELNSFSAATNMALTLGITIHRP
jgi:hypothetical protein